MHVTAPRYFPAFMMASIYLQVGFPGGAVVQNLPANAGDEEMWVQSLGQEDTLEKEMATHSRTPAWKSPWTEEPGGLQSTGSQRLNN